MRSDFKTPNPSHQKHRSVLVFLSSQAPLRVHVIVQQLCTVDWRNVHVLACARGWPRAHRDAPYGVLRISGLHAEPTQRERRV